MMRDRIIASSVGGGGKIVTNMSGRCPLAVVLALGHDAEKSDSRQAVP
jgi:hypothetical protein